MFTGIVQKLGKVAEVQNLAHGNARRVRLRTGFTDLTLGESIAVNGVCLTVIDPSHGAAESAAESGLTDFEIGPETLALTNLGRLEAGAAVNLERALRLQDRISGHLVQGHVDGQGTVARIGRDGDAFLLEVALPAPLARYCVNKGSIALDGVSLTVASLDGARVRIMLIPHTWNHTRFSATQVGESLNVEVDMMAKYLEKLCQPYAPPSNP